MEALKVIFAVCLVIASPSLTPEDEGAGLRTIFIWFSLAAAVGVVVVAFLLSAIQAIFNQGVRKRLMKFGFLQGWGLYVGAGIVYVFFKFKGFSASLVGELIGGAVGVVLIYGVLTLVQVGIRRIVEQVRKKPVQ